jgi:hypothetical protein
MIAVDHDCTMGGDPVGATWLDLPILSASGRRKLHRLWPIAPAFRPH